MHRTFSKEEPIVDITGLNYTFGQGESSKQVLFDNNLRILPGEIVIMTGPSGSGKTTLLTLIGALRAVQEGSARIMGQELKGLKAEDQVLVRRDIGFIFQAHNLFNSLTARQNVRLSLDVHEYAPETAKEMAADMLRKLDLAERIEYLPRNLSGGQQQRVAIGRALVGEPRIVLADEPTAALDKMTGRMVVELFRSMAHEIGTTIFIVTHDNRILDVADRIINMVDGRVSSNVEVALNVQIANFLSKIELFEKFPPQFLADVAAEMSQQSHEPGADVVVEGEVGDKFYVIRSGRMQVLKMTDGEQQEVGTLGPGDFFGELALIREEPRAATVRALEPVETVDMNKATFLNLVENSSSFEEQVRNAYFRR